MRRAQGNGRDMFLGADAKRNRLRTMVRWIDVSMPMYEGMLAWPGDEPFAVRADRRIARGDGCNTSCLTLHTHTGTHMDAPWHFIETGSRLHEVDSQLFFGEALIVDVSGKDVISAEDIPRNGIRPRVLFKTDNSTFPIDDKFRKHYVALTPDAAERLVEQGVKLVGIDYLSIGPFKEPGHLTHIILLRHNIVVVEGLRLAEVPAGVHSFVVLPLPLQGLDGSPCRAFVGMEEE